MYGTRLLSLETEARLGRLLLHIADGERKVEIVRQVLAEQTQFEPYAAFLRLDINNNGCIGSTELLRFLRLNGIMASESEIFKLIAGADKYRDGTIRYADFLKLVMPSNRTLRELATLRTSRTPKPGLILPYDVEYALARVLDRELEMQRQTEYLRGELSRRYDFNILDAFRTLDTYQDSYITADEIAGYFRRKGEYLDALELNNIMRRMDLDNDGKISYLEFIESVLPYQKSSYQERFQRSEPKRTRALNSQPPIERQERRTSPKPQRGELGEPSPLRARSRPPVDSSPSYSALRFPMSSTREKYYSPSPTRRTVAYPITSTTPGRDSDIIYKKFLLDLEIREAKKRRDLHELQMRMEAQKTLERHERQKRLERIEIERELEKRNEERKKEAEKRLENRLLEKERIRREALREEIEREQQQRILADKQWADRLRREELLKEYERKKKEEENAAYEKQILEEYNKKKALEADKKKAMEAAERREAIYLDMKRKEELQDSIKRQRLRDMEIREASREREKLRKKTALEREIDLMRAKERAHREYQLWLIRRENERMDRQKRLNNQLDIEKEVRRAAQLEKELQRVREEVRLRALRREMEIDRQRQNIEWRRSELERDLRSKERQREEVLARYEDRPRQISTGTSTKEVKKEAPRGNIVAQEDYQVDEETEEPKIVDQREDTEDSETEIHGDMFRTPGEAKLESSNYSGQEKETPPASEEERKSAMMYATPEKKEDVANVGKAEAPKMSMTEFDEPSTVGHIVKNRAGKEKIEDIPEKARLQISNDMFMAFKEQIYNEQKLEEAKEDLSMCNDFSLQNVFKVLDVGTTGKITLKNLEEGLKKYGIYPTSDERFLFMKSFDKNKNESLRFSEFSNAFLPKNPQFAQPLKTRAATSMPMSRDTQQLHSKVWNLLFDTELALERVRTIIYKKDFILYHAFQCCGAGKKGYIAINDLAEMLKDAKYKNQDINLLMSRYDKDKDGKITYTEVFLYIPYLSLSSLCTN